VLKPRDESDPTKDTDGNALEWSGSAYPRRPVYRDSYLSTWNGTTEYLSAAHLAGSETVVSSVGTSTPSISAGRIDFTAGTCSALVLSDGTIYNFTEGVGATIHDTSGNNNNGIIVNASTATEGAGFWAGRIDGEDNAHNANNGFSKRMLFDGVDDTVLCDGVQYATKTKGKIIACAKTNTGATQTICAFSDETDTTSDMRLIFQSGKIRFTIREAGSFSLNLVTTASYHDNELHTIEVEVTDSGNTILIDGVSPAITYTAGDATTKKWIADVNDVDVFGIGKQKRGQLCRRGCL
jgi:hypothetical protein